MVRQQPQQHQTKISDIPDYPAQAPFPSTNNTNGSSTPASSNCNGRYFVLPLSIPATPVHAKLSSIIQDQKKLQYDSQQKYREWYMAYKEAILARKKTLELEHKVDLVRQQIDSSMKEIEDEKEKVKNKLNAVIKKRDLPSEDEVKASNSISEEQRPKKKQKNNTGDINDPVDNDIIKESSKKKKKSKKSLNSEPDSSDKLKQSNEESLETIKSKYARTKLELDSQHRTKSQFIWLLKQVITAENKRKEDKDKNKEQKQKK